MAARSAAAMTLAGDLDAARRLVPRIRDWADALESDTGLLASRTNSLKQRQTQNDKQQSVVQDRIDRTEARLRAQYQRLDTQMSSLNAQMNGMKDNSVGRDGILPIKNKRDTIPLHFTCWLLSSS